MLPTLHVGFTGTQKGMTENQAARVRSLLVELGATDAHHGDCIGADADFHAMCLELGLRVHIHPPANDTKRAFCQGAVSTATPREYLTRNRDIVDASHVLIAAPRGAKEQRRSGTWATIRNARTAGKPLHLVFPDGSVQTEKARSHGSGSPP